MAERQRPGVRSRLTWPDPAWLTLPAETVPTERLAAMRLIVTPGMPGEAVTAEQMGSLATRIVECAAPIPIPTARTGR